MSSQNIKISMIIPVFNKEQTVRRAVESVLKQGLLPTEYEMLLIDDGSTDTSIDICRQLAVENPETIRFFTKKNEGVGPTRNYGIHIAEGEYLCFLDADDYLKEGGLRSFIDNFYDSRFDILSYFSTTVIEGKEETALKKDIHGKIIYETTGHKLLGDGYCTKFIWNSLYKKSFLIENGIKFEPFAYSEDFLFNINAMYANPLIRQTSSFIYVYITYEGNHQLTKKRNPEAMTSIVFDFLNIFERMGEISRIMERKNIPCNMNAIFANSQEPFISRLLSSSTTVKQLREIRKRINDTGLNQSKSPNKIYRISQMIINSGHAFPLIKFFYKSVFLPYILPRIDRETGNLS